MSSEQSPYQPQGKCIDVLTAQDEEICVVGPAGTGKSRVDLTKLFIRAEKYPKSRHLICRQTRESCTDTCLVTWEDEVVPSGHPCLKGGQRKTRHSYLFPNGSEVVVLGLDKPEKLFSSQWDTVLVVEAIETQLDTAEKFSRAMRNFKTPYHQRIYETNPGPANHWLKDRIDKKTLRCVATTHKDNARYYDERAGDWTEEGRRYREGLSLMTGTRLMRLFLGEWGVAEGARWPWLDPAIHRFDKNTLWPQGIPEFYKKWVSIDHGFGSPYAALWHCSDSEGNVYTYRGDYGPGFTADMQAERVVDRSPENEHFYAEYLDPSMWHQDPRARGKATGEISAAALYVSRFGQEDCRARFGPVQPGSRVQRVIGFSTLDRLLGRDNGHPNWFIDYSVPDLWNELTGAVLSKSDVTGKWGDDLDPKCFDHAITCAVYGLHTHYELPLEVPRHWSETYDPVEYRLEQERIRIEESEREFEQRANRPSVRY